LPFGFIVFPFWTRQGHQVEHVDAVLGHLLTQDALHAARHLLLNLHGERQQAHPCAVDRQIGMQCHVRAQLKGLKD